MTFTPLGRPGTRPGTPGDAIDGVVPDSVATPRTVKELAEVLEQASSARQEMVIVGNRTKQDWGSPPARLALGIETGGLEPILQHDASDLVVRVGASVPLARLNTELARLGQRLSVDEMVPGTSIGGLLATGVSGPLRYGFGAVRDLVIGVSVVRPDGITAASGGRVVKNVAGYDLAKLYTGSYGTLGVITEAYFRLHALSEAVTYLVAELRLDDLAGSLRALVHSQVAPSAIEVSYDSDRMVVGVLIEGSETGVDRRSAVVESMLGVGTVRLSDPPAWWGSLPGTTTLKVTAEIASVASLLNAIGEIAVGRDRPLSVTGSAGTGVLYIGTEIAPGTPATDIEKLVLDLRSATAAAGGSCTVLRAPTQLRSALDIWGPVPAIELMRRVKDQFDPYHLLAPGRFVGGI